METQTGNEGMGNKSTELAAPVPIAAEKSADANTETIISAKSVAKVSSSSVKATKDAVHKTISRTKMASAELKKRFDKYRNTLTNSDFFKNKCKGVFESVDMDKSGTVDIKELYAAVLLVYLQLAKIVRGLTPPTQDDVRALMKKVDMDGQEDLTLEEFTELTSILVGNIFTRIVVQLGLTLFIVPLIATIVMTILCYISPPHQIWSYIIPKGLPTTILAAIITMLVVPKMLDVVDNYYTSKQTDDLLKKSI